MDIHPRHTSSHDINNRERRPMQLTIIFMVPDASWNATLSYPKPAVVRTFHTNRLRHSPHRSKKTASLSVVEMSIQVHDLYESWRMGDCRGVLSFASRSHTSFASVRGCIGIHRGGCCRRASARPRRRLACLRSLLDCALHFLCHTYLLSLFTRWPPALK